ncbi:XRE family transcriptional regulator [Billgrantia ethanolica]|uniref:XRE family transcriptional regulator n=1 Tax=Billgrantia ethanolica TaxID=2733486 RepID=UPI001F43BD2A|nr:XRE family transcriptional regulator [Halomonas ethanolica]
MTYQEFLRQLGKAGLTVKEFSELVGMNRNSVSNYAGRTSVPTHLAVISKLMGEMAEQGIDFRKTLAGLEAVPKKPRGASRNRRLAEMQDRGDGTVSRTKGDQDE